MVGEFCARLWWMIAFGLERGASPIREPATNEFSMMFITEDACASFNMTSL